MESRIDKLERGVECLKKRVVKSKTSSKKCNKCKISFKSLSHYNSFQILFLIERLLLYWIFQQKHQKLNNPLWYFIMYIGVEKNKKNRADSDRKQSEPRADPDRTPKRTCQSGLLINCLDQSAHWLISCPIALTNQRAKESFSVNQYVFFSSTFGLNLCILLEKTTSINILLKWISIQIFTRNLIMWICFHFFEPSTCIHPS